MGKYIKAYFANKNTSSTVSFKIVQNFTKLANKNEKSSNNPHFSYHILKGLAQYQLRKRKVKKITQFFAILSELNNTESESEDNNQNEGIKESENIFQNEISIKAKILIKVGVLSKLKICIEVKV